MIARRLLCLGALLAGCRTIHEERAPPSPVPSDASASASIEPPADASTPAIAPSAAASPAVPSASSGIGRGDAGAVCRVLRGPIELPIHVPACLAVREDGVEVTLNEDGHPRVVALRGGPVALGAIPAGREPLQGEKGTGYGVPCATAGERVYCPDRSGQVHRSTRGESDDRVVASSRPSSRISASTLGDAHVALGYLASRQTSEGWLSEAWIAVDDDPPVRASDDGSGATALTLAPRGPGLLALMVDARTALTAMHARPVIYERRARLGDDAVVFVGGPGDRRTRAALAVPSATPAWALLPIAKDIGTFGLAVVRIDDPASVDEPVVWAMYPNGLDPAPIAAASGPRTPSAWLALVRPQAAEPGSPHVLEIGELGANGAVILSGPLPTTGNPSDVALSVDASGALWLAWVDSAGSWIERLACAGRSGVRP